MGKEGALALLEKEPKSCQTPDCVPQGTSLAAGVSVAEPTSLGAIEAEVDVSESSGRSVVDAVEAKGLGLLVPMFMLSKRDTSAFKAAEVSAPLLELIPVAWRRS